MAIIVGLTMAVMLGFVGLAVDGGRLYLTKTELQNAADSCALAAAYELTGSPIPAEAFARADAAAETVASRNRVEFQGTSIQNSNTLNVTLRYNESVSSNNWLSAGSAANTSAKYVKCTIQNNGIKPYFMQVLGIGDQVVGASATATLVRAQTNCSIPLGVCTKGGSAPNFGRTTGDWIALDFVEQTSGSDTNVNGWGTGNFRWIDFNPQSVTPGCNGDGKKELACLLQGTGQCSVPAPIATSCSSSGSATPALGCVGSTGSMNALEVAYNSRFGLYKNGPGNPQPTTAAPDYTGYSYSNDTYVLTWSIGRDAYTNYKSARASHLSTQPNFIASNGGGGGGGGGNPNAGKVSNTYSATTSTGSPPSHASNGADRRLVVVPFVDCDGFAGGGNQHAPVRGYACVLMLDPYRKGGGSSSNTVMSKLEYLGPANQSGSPCASSGIAGDANSQGPLVPALVQ